MEAQVLTEPIFMRILQFESHHPSEVEKVVE